jgi:phage terminase small subunit
MLGAANAKQTKLTAKQAKFAQALALGETKAGAYRAAYDTQASPTRHSNEGQRLAKNPMISHQVEALRLAAEARNYATPPALRALVIERLTAHAIDDTINPAQRLRALELLGKITEVAAFTERREIVRVTDSGTARDKLLVSLREALQASAIDVTPKSVALEPETAHEPAPECEPLPEAAQECDRADPPTP